MAFVSVDFRMVPKWTVPRSKGFPEYRGCPRRGMYLRRSEGLNL